MTDIIQAKETAPLGYHYTNAGILPNEWTSRPLSSIVEEIAETAGTRKIETVSISAGVGFVNQAEKFGKELSGKQYEKYTVLHRGVPFPVSWTVKMKKKQKETQDILSYHTQAAGCSDKARAKASGGRQPIEECGRTGL